jgi:glutamate synthase domain-containing protein 1
MELKYSKDGKVVFNEQEHTYYLGNKKLTGITSIISKYKNKFDSDLIATNYAIKHNLKKENVLKEWKEKGEYSCNQGTEVHKIIENYILTGEINLSNIYPKEKIAVKFIEEIFKTNKLTPIETELIVYNDKIASQIDLIAMNNKGDLFILDFKTNSKIETNGYNKYMLHPFNLLPDASFYHYSIQLSIYKKLCKEYNIKDIYIIHIDENDYFFIKAALIDIPDELY